ncbi:hypothetical protein SAMN02745885_01670 [Carboxydocella sporoproducens DSM 16521]|uniref:Uncharacterized protein n=2 Tax=Carboxydocella TaxID=178898 RepID=A0A1T4QGV4_9FIRM|nr:MULTISPECIES: hypothetical protein [Carboxydocella]AVX21581.1 hypothetical protein CFE_2438 [Carboxydocella thermautotrophica]SKA02847.1 hypothetical protein SAMN02745885_01670 [Carboxydocella sporoproducens DSM 16521]
MPATGKWYGQALLKALNKEIDWDTDAIKVMLCSSAYVPDQDNHVYLSSITNEVTGTGYTAGGQVLTAKTITYDAVNNKIILDAADITWPSATITARYAVLYVDTGNPATSPLLGYVDFGQDVSSTNGNFTIAWDAAGIFTITVG